MNKRVKLQSPSRSSDEAGGATVTWTDVASIWAAIEPLTGKEPYVVAQQLQGQVSHKVTIRYRSGLTPGMRVLYDSRIFDVKSVIDPKERHSILILACEEVV